MATKITPPPPVLSNTYYAYYDKITKELLAVTNEPIKLYPDFLEINYDIYKQLVSGEEKFSNYLLGQVKADGKTSLLLVPKNDSQYDFKNTMIEIVDEAPSESTELTVVWNKQSWTFNLSTDAKLRIENKIHNESRVDFFVVSSNDYNLLIRTISIDLKKLCDEQTVTFEFVDNREQNIKDIVLLSLIHI